MADGAGGGSGGGLDPQSLDFVLKFLNDHGLAEVSVDDVVLSLSMLPIFFF